MGSKGGGIWSSSPLGSSLPALGGPPGSNFPPLPAPPPSPNHPLMPGFAPPSYLPSGFGSAQGFGAALQMHTPMGARIKPMWTRSGELDEALEAPPEIQAIMGADPGRWPDRAEEVATRLRLPYNAWYAFLEVLGHAEPDRWPGSQRASVTDIAALPAHLLARTLREAKISVWNAQSWWDDSLNPRPPEWDPVGFRWVSFLFTASARLGLILV